VFVFAQQGASQVEPFGFLGIAGASHMTYKYALLCHKSRALSSPRTSRCFRYAATRSNSKLSFAFRLS
jgi:hypothetical protein